MSETSARVGTGTFPTSYWLNISLSVGKEVLRHAAEYVKIFCPIMPILTYDNKPEKASPMWETP